MAFNLLGVLNLRNILGKLASLDLSIDEFTSTKLSRVEGDFLFSPGHPSGEDFQNFEIRGNSFKEKVNEYFS